MRSARGPNVNVKKKSLMPADAFVGWQDLYKLNTNRKAEMMKKLSIDTRFNANDSDNSVK